MMEALRQGAGTLVAKVLIGLLAASFAVWGISDVFTGGQRGALATVGDQKILEQQYQRAFQTRLRAMSQQFGRQLSLQQARQLGLDRQVLQELVSQAALDDQISKLALAIPDETIANSIVKNPRFRDAQGKFDKARFGQFLRSNGLTEAGFVALDRRNKLRTHLAGAIENNLIVPNTILKALHRQANETRQASYFTVPVSSLGQIPEPTDKDVQTFYASNKARFTAPESRALTMVMLEPKGLAKTVIKVSEEDLRKSYKERADEFTTAETRTIEQISFNTKQEAEAARKKLDGGMDFSALAKELKLKPTDIQLGTLTRKDIPDPKIAEAAFGLALNSVSPLVEGALTNALLRVSKITPEVKKSFDEVKTKLRDAIALERAQEKVLNLHDTVEDERAGGANLKEIAEKLNLPLIVINAIDASGKGPDGKPVATLPKVNGLLAKAFQSDIGVENDPADTQNEGFIWFDVTKITPSAVRPLKEVRAQAVTLWKASKQRELLIAKARALMEAVRKGADLASQAKSITQEVKTTKAIKRTETDGVFGPQAVASLFRTAKGGTSQATAKDGGMIVYQVKEVATPPFVATAKEAVAVKNLLTRRMSQDLVQQYLNGIQSNAGVDINAAVWRRLQGRTPGS